jgi:RNA polymerase sigma factor (sigma-70 family)
MAFPALLERARAGDRQAQDELIERFYPSVREAVHQRLEFDLRRNQRWVAPLFSTNDVVQEVFVGIVRTLPDFEGESEEDFVRYLSGAVRNRIIDALRHHAAGRRDGRRGRTPEVEVSGSDPTPSWMASLAEQMEVYRAAVAELPEREQRVLEARLEEDQQFKDIALALGLPSADAARKAFHRAQARLLAKLHLRGMRKTP